MNENSENNANSEDNNSKENNNGNLQESKNEINEGRRPDSWMVRPCDMYKEEYSDCTSIKARFNQYFIFGEYIDCSQWKKDFENCEKWYKYKDEAAYQAILKSETDRRITRFRAHYANDVWKKREKPPEDWNKPLPEWLQAKFTNSYLDHKSRNIKSGEINDFDQKLCTIL